MAGVIAQCDRSPVLTPQTAEGRENEYLVARHALWVPTHACVLGQAEQIARRPIEEHFRRERKFAGRTRSGGRDVKEVRRHR